MSDVVMNMLVRRRKLGNATFVFPARGRAGHLVEVKYFFAEIAASTGVKVTAHDLRRTYAREARACGLDLYGIKLLLNRSVKSDVTAGYIGGQSEDMAPQIQAIANHLKRLCNIESSTAANVVQLAK
jgi:integrase